VEGKSGSHCQCQAADGDSGGDHGDCRSPDAAGKKVGASLRFTEGQYFLWLTWSLRLCGFLKVHGRRSRRPAAWRPWERHVGLLDNVNDQICETAPCKAR
jgi:hypothetical protein